MKKTKIKHRLSIVIRVLFSVSLMVLVLGVGNTVLGDNLATAEGTGTSVTAASDTYIDVATATLDVTNVNKVMVIATFEVGIESGATSNNRTATFRLAADVTPTINSNTIDRQLEKEKLGDKGIGSLVYIFDVSSKNGNIVFRLEHKTNNTYNNTTKATIVVVALSTTTGQVHLNNDMKSITANVAVPDANAWGTVTGLETSAVSLPVSGSIFVVASVNNELLTGNSQSGEWKLQQRKGLNGTYTDIGLPISRSIGGPSDRGIASLGMIVTGLAKDDYYFQLLHKGSNTSVTTLNTTLIAVALAYDDATLGGRRFPAFNSEDVIGASTSSSTFANALSIPGEPATTTDMLFYAQYNMSTTSTTGMNAPSFDMHVTGPSYSYSSQTQQRRLTDENDTGAGASVGMAQGISNPNTYTASVRHASVDNTLTLNTFNIILSGFQTNDIPAEGYWMGGTSTDWNNTANWANTTIPTSTTNITIYSGKDNDPVIGATGTATCNDLFIESGATLTIESTSSGTGSLIVEGTSTDDIIFKRYVNEHAKANTWHYVSSPVAGQTLNGTWITNNSILFNDPASQLYRYDEDTDYWIYYEYTGTEPEDFSDTEFVTARSYAITRNGAGELSFTGTIRTDATINYAATYTADKGTGFNLVGNPFTSTIAITTDGQATDNFLADNTAILDDSYEAIYIWNETDAYTYGDNDYQIICNSGFSGVGQGTEINQDFIQPGQGFMVKVNTTGNIVFNKDTQKHGTATFYKSKESWPGVELKVSGNSFSNSTAICFNQNMTNGLDPSYDVGKMRGNPNIALYTKLINDNGVDFAIQALPLSNTENYIVSVGLDVLESQEIEFSTYKVDLDGYDIILEDRLLDVFTNLSSDIYTVTVSQSGTGRFFLHFRDIDGIDDDIYKQKTIRTYASSNTLYILNPEMKQGTVTIYNLTGQKAATFKLTGDTKQQQTLNINDIINVVQINTDNEVISKKVIFK